MSYPHASVRLYADNPMWRASDSPPATIPTNISTTRARPDIVLIEDTSVNILEPTNTREALQAARKRKSVKPLYNFQLINDLEDRGLLISFIQNSGNWLPWSLAIYEPCAIKCLTCSYFWSLETTCQKLSWVSIACSYTFLIRETAQAGTQTNLSTLFYMMYFCFCFLVALSSSSPRKPLRVLGCLNHLVIVLISCIHI